MNKSFDTAADILGCVADYFGLSTTALCGRSRRHLVVYARQLAIWCIRQECEYLSISDIAYFFGRDHSTIIYSLGIVKNRLIYHRQTQRIVAELRRLGANQLERRDPAVNLFLQECGL